MAYDLSELRAAIKPFRLHWFPRLRSTNDYAAILRQRGELFAPAIVLTGHQLAGRGRGSNTWWSGNGSLTVTFVFAAEEHLAPHHVPLLAGLAVRNAAAELTGVDDIQLKWPNDLLHRGRKLAGLLCERVFKADLVGLGMNVNVEQRDIPIALRQRVTSLREIVGHPLDMTRVLASIAQQLYRAIARRDENSFAAAMREYDRHHALLGRRVSVSNNGDEPMLTGKCEGLDETGRLLLRDTRRRTLHRVIAGHVQAL
jgi:BirA family biotin operon repressor/biotin-[acetyl-CoA-carboxylase] ligase